MGTAYDDLTIDEILAGFPVEDSGATDLFQESESAVAELGAVIKGLAPDVGRTVIGKFNDALLKRVAAVEDTFGVAINDLTVATMLQGNGGVSLLGPSGVGVLYASGANIPLYPAIAGVSTGVPWQLNEDVTVYEAFMSQEDIAAGWQVVANSLKYGSDPYSGFGYDCSGIIWDARATTKRPLVSIFTITGPEGGNPLNLSVNVINHGPAAAPFGGITLTIRDARCKPSKRLLQPRYLTLLQSAASGDLVKAILAKAAGAIQSRPQTVSRNTGIARKLAGALGVR